MSEAGLSRVTLLKGRVTEYEGMGEGMGRYVE